MIIAAIVVGLLTAYYFGLRPGGYAAGASALLFLAAMVIPSAAFYAYGLVGVGTVGVLVAGPRVGNSDNKKDLLSLLRRVVSRVVSASRSLRK